MTSLNVVSYRRVFKLCKTVILHFAAEHPLREKNKKTKKQKKKKIADKIKNHLFRRGFSPRKFAETLREISRWVSKDLMFLHADSEDSDQTKKLSECPA